MDGSFIMDVGFFDKLTVKLTVVTREDIAFYWDCEQTLLDEIGDVPLFVSSFVKIFYN